MCPAQGPGGSVETLYCMFSTGKTPGFLCLSGVSRVVHGSHPVFVLKEPCPQLTFECPIEKHASLVETLVPILQTLLRLRQVTKQTMRLGGLQSQWHQGSGHYITREIRILVSQRVICRGDRRQSATTPNVPLQKPRDWVAFKTLPWKQPRRGDHR